MVVKVIELIGVSSTSYEDAVKVAVARAAKSLKNISGVDIIGQSAKVKDGKVTEFRVNLKLAFVIKE